MTGLSRKRFRARWARKTRSIRPPRPFSGCWGQAFGGGLLRKAVDEVRARRCELGLSLPSTATGAYSIARYRQLHQALIDGIARDAVPHRPFRIEPRVLKKRQKPFSLMTRPRQQLQRKILGEIMLPDSPITAYPECRRWRSADQRANSGAIGTWISSLSTIGNRSGNVRRISGSDSRS